ncbi:MAG: C2H2-type zinc finger protein [Bacteroidaceae bacterium]|nr:C2H2-type zinc finger protein [Bacteroidaceae bacterium]
MTYNKQISVKVCGNPESNSGFMPLVLFNSPSFQIPDIMYSGFDANSFFFTIKIEADQVVYKIIKNNVNSYGAFREGSLAIGMSIPRGYKLDGGYSPYDVLVALKDAFLSLCMTCKDPITERYEFNKGFIEPKILDETANRFTISPASGPFRPMAGSGPTGYLTASPDNIRLLMNDVHYSEFSSYGEIILAPIAQAPGYAQIENLPIPRVQEFSIIKNGLKDGFVRSASERISISGVKDSRYYKNSSVDFSIDEIRGGKVVNGVTIDEANEVITINTESLSTPLERKITITFNNKTVEKHFFTHIKGITLVHRSSGRILPVDNNLAFTVRGEVIAILQDVNGFELSLANNDKYRITSTKLQGEELKVVAEEIKVAPTHTPTPAPTTAPLPGSEKKVVINFNAEQYQQHTDEGRLQIKITNQHGKTLRTNVFLKKKDRAYTAEVNEIPATWFREQLDIRFDEKEKYYVASVYNSNKSEILLKFDDFVAVPKGWWKIYVKPHLAKYTLVIGIILGLIGGFFIGLWLYPLINGEEEASGKKFKCDICSDIFGAQDELNKHKKEKHPPYKCSVCGERFSSKAEKDEHIAKGCPKTTAGSEEESHAIEDSFKCEKCELSFPSQEKLDMHMRDTHPIEEPPAETFDCDECSMKFIEESALNAHKKKVHPKFKCTVKGCTREFSSKAELMTHKKNDHVVYTCKRCGTWFNSEDELTGHMRTKRHGVRGER